MRDQITIPPEEEWRPVDGFELDYSVSNLGRVRRETSGRATYAGRLLKVRPNPKGYLYVFPSAQGKRRVLYIHSLVAKAFIGPRPEGYEVNHRDGDKTNNTRANLEYVTGTDNIRHGFAEGLIVSPKGTAHGMAILTVDEVKAIREMARQGRSQRSIAIAFGVAQGTVSAVILRKHWAHIP
jgi:hypothetical protein